MKPIHLPDITSTARRILRKNGPYRVGEAKAYHAALKLLGCLILPLLVMFLPEGWLLEGLTITQQRTVFIFLLAAVFWIVEPIPVFATSVLVIFLELLLISDQALILQGSEVGEVLGYKQILSSFASPIIFLFLGGFFLAISATKYGLDQVMAKAFIKPFGSKPAMVMLGLMSITAVFSMFMSNTATTAMMLSILMPFLKSMDAHDRGKVGFVLAIPIAANIGGLGTPIGTPPNALAIKYLDMTFGKWMLIGVPFVIVMLFIAWVLLRTLFPPSAKSVQLEVQAENALGAKSVLVYGIFALTVLLWLTDFVHGLNAYVVSFLPIVAFFGLNILDKEDLKLVSWDVLWLVSGGLALGLAIEATGLAAVVIQAVPFGTFPLPLIFALAAGLGLIVANFMSNTATANLMLPLIAVLGMSLPEVLGQRGDLLTLSTTICISMGMALPISTPPNALAYSTGLVTTKHMAGIGVALGIIGMILMFVFAYVIDWIGLMQ